MTTKNLLGPSKNDPPLLNLDEQIKDCGMGGPVPNFSGRIQKHIPQPLSFSSVVFQKNLLIYFSDRLDCGLKHAAMTTTVRHSGVGRSPVSLGMKLI